MNKIETIVFSIVGLVIIGMATYGTYYNIVNREEILAKSKQETEQYNQFEPGLGITSKGQLGISVMPGQVLNLSNGKMQTGIGF